jgi:hypothetical protein
MKNWLVTCAALVALAIPFAASGASAATIDYIFSGTATFTLNGVAFSDAPFTLTYVSDTSTISNGGGEYANAGVGTFVSGSTSVTMTGDTFDGVVIFSAIADDEFRAG